MRNVNMKRFRPQLFSNLPWMDSGLGYQKSRVPKWVWRDLDRFLSILPRRTHLNNLVYLMQATSIARFRIRHVISLFHAPLYLRILQVRFLIDWKMSYQYLMDREYSYCWCWRSFKNWETFKGIARSHDLSYFRRCVYRDWNCNHSHYSRLPSEILYG